MCTDFAHFMRPRPSVRGPRVGLVLAALLVLGSPAGHQPMAWGQQADGGAAVAAATPAGELASTASHAENGQADASGATTAKLIASLTIFVLAIFVGFEVITKVPPTLHTPLMSGSNAISGITVVGSLVAAGSRNMDFAAWLGMIAVALATVNVVGGFLVTHRMLGMFRKKK